MRSRIKDAGFVLFFLLVIAVVAVQAAEKLVDPPSRPAPEHTSPR